MNVHQPFILLKILNRPWNCVTNLLHKVHSLGLASLLKWPLTSESSNNSLPEPGYCTRPESFVRWPTNFFFVYVSLWWLVGLTKVPTSRSSLVHRSKPFLHFLLHSKRWCFEPTQTPFPSPPRVGIVRPFRRARTTAQKPPSAPTLFWGYNL